MRGPEVAPLNPKPPSPKGPAPTPPGKPEFEYKNPTDEQIARKNVIKCSNLLHDAGAVVETLDMEGRDERAILLNGKRISIARQRIKQARKALDRLAVDLNRRGAM